MKKNKRFLFVPLLLLLTGIVISTSSFVANGESDSIPNTVLVSGIDCSYKEVKYDPYTGKILGYWAYAASYSDCLIFAGKTCDPTKTKRCENTNAPVWEPAK